MVEQVAGQLGAVSREQAPRAHRIGAARVEHVAAHDPQHVAAQLVRIPQPRERVRGEVCTHLFVVLAREARLGVVVQAPVGAAPGDVRLAQVMEQRRKPHGERRSGVGGRLDDGERVLVDGHVVIATLLLEADRPFELREDGDEHARVARDAQRLGGLRAEQQLRELAHAVRSQTAADPLTRDEADAVGVLAHLLQRGVVGLETELRDEAQPAHDPKRVLGEAVRRDRAQDAAPEVPLPVVRIDERPVGEAAGHRVDREVATREIVLHRRLGVDDDREVVTPGPVETSRRGGASSIPAGTVARSDRSRG